MASMGWVWAYVVLAAGAVAVLSWVVSAWIGKRAAREQKRASTAGVAPPSYGGSSTGGGVAPYAGGDDSGFFLALHQQISSWGDSGSNVDCGGHGGGSSDHGCGSDGGSSCGSSCGGSD